MNKHLMASEESVLCQALLWRKQWVKFYTCTTLKGQHWVFTGGRDDQIRFYGEGSSKIVYQWNNLSWKLFAYVIRDSKIMGHVSGEWETWKTDALLCRDALPVLVAKKHESLWFSFWAVIWWFINC